MTKKILVLGCSHVSGHGFEDTENGKEISEHVWASKISRDFKYEVINLSSPGQSPTYCIEQIQNFPNKETLSAIMVMWPHSERTLQRHSVSTTQDNDVPYHHNLTGFPRWDNIMVNYFKLCHNWRVNKINLLAYIGYVKSLSYELNIPIWMSTTTGEDNDFLKSKNIKLDTPSDWCSYCQLNKFPKLPDDHWGHEAHEMFYKSFVKNWIKSNIS